MREGNVQIMVHSNPCTAPCLPACLPCRYDQPDIGLAGRQERSQANGQSVIHNPNSSSCKSAAHPV